METRSMAWTSPEKVSSLKCVTATIIQTTRVHDPDVAPPKLALCTALAQLIGNRREADTRLQTNGVHRRSRRRLGVASQA